MNHHGIIPLVPPSPATLLVLAGISLAKFWKPSSAPALNWTDVASSADGTKLVAPGEGES